MKKTIILATVLGALVSAPAFAKTEGSSVGVSVIKTDTKRILSAKNNKNIGVGVDYKYAFNFDKVFVAPGIFYDYNHARASQDLGGNQSAQLKLKSSYGAKVNLGYDICDKLAAFVTLGLSNTNVATGVNFNKNLNSGTKVRGGVVYGLGVKYALNDLFDVNAALETTRYNVGSGTNKYNTSRYDTLRVGTAVKF